MVSEDDSVWMSVSGEGAVGEGGGMCGDNSAIEPHHLWSHGTWTATGRPKTPDLKIPKDDKVVTHHRRLILGKVTRRSWPITSSR